MKKKTLFFIQNELVITIKVFYRIEFKNVLQRWCTQRDEIGAKFSHFGALVPG